MRVTILTVGSRGDVQPYAALARGILARGHQVRLATHRRFRWLTDEVGVPHHALDEEPLLTFQRSFSARGLRHPRSTWHRAHQSFQAALDEWDEAVAGSDLLLAHPKIFVAPELARRHRAEVAFASTLPVLCPTAEFPCCYLSGTSRGAIFNRLSYRVLPLAMAPHRRWSRRWLAEKGVRGIPSGRWDLRHRDGRPVVHLHGHSKAVLPQPSDWPRAWRTTGYWRVPTPEGWTPEPALADFLDSGAPPVYVGFGSMVHRGDRRSLVRDLVAPLLERGERVLLVRGWALEEDPLGGDERVHFIDAYEGPWHGWLFPRVRAVVHHGGPGTLGAALHAGKPQLCCPFAMDQPFWAGRARELGVAPEPLPMKAWSRGAWAGRVAALLDRPEIARAADSMSRRLASEDGVAVAVAALEELAG